MPSSTIRAIARTVLPALGNEVPGVKIRRPIHGEFMPFLLLDDIESHGKTSGFGDHPHRGQETITYILEGSLVHQDNKGNKGTLHPGDLQFMRAGRGIVHNETPITDPETNSTRAVQIWVALPATNSLDQPGYKDVLGKDCKVVSPSKGVHIKVIAGEAFGHTAPVFTKVQVWYFDIRLEQGAKVTQAIPKGWNCFILPLSGTPTVQEKTVKPHEAIFFKRDGSENVEISNNHESDVQLLLLAGDPLDGQEVHRYGPFISHEKSGPSKALLDYRMGINGFEGAHQWKSNPVHN